VAGMQPGRTRSYKDSAYLSPALSEEISTKISSEPARQLVIGELF